MTSQVTLQVTVDPSGAVTGTGVVTSSINNMTNSANASLSKLQKSFSDLDGFIKRATTSVAGFFAAFAAVKGLEHLLDRLIEVNNMYTQFTATLSAVKDSSKAANDEFEYLLATSNRLGQNVESMSKNYMRLAASMKHVDSSGESTRHVFEGVATAASVLHLKGYEANGILIAFEQILSKNKLSLEEVQRQLSNRLPDAMGTAARSMGMSQQQFREGITKGTIPALEFVLRMANELKKEYGDAAQKTADAFVGQQARMHNAVMNLYRSVGQSGAMEGLTKILKSITEVLDDPSIGQALGQSLNEVFSNIADWISKLTQSDIHDFFDGMAGIVKSVVIIMRELIRSFSDTVDGESDFLSFARNVSNGMLTMIEVINTLVAGILAIPAALKYANSAYDLFGKLSSPKRLGIGQSDQEKADYEKGIKDSMAAKEAAGKDVSAMMKKFLADGTLPKARSDINSVFDNLKTQRDLRNSRPKAEKKDFGTGGMLTNDQIKKLASEGEKPTPKKEKGRGRDAASIFNTESVTLAKAAGTAMLEYNNIMNDTLGIENKYATQLEIKLKYDRDFIKLSSQQKESLRSLAKEADQAVAKQEAARAFQTDKLNLNKGLYQSELELLDISEFRSASETKHQREFEEKLKFDVKYKAFSEDMIKIERDRAKALDELTQRVEAAKKVEASRYSTHVLDLQVQRDLLNNSKGFGASAYNERDKVLDTIRQGGENFGLDPKSKLKLLDDASKRDQSAKDRDFGAFSYTTRDNLSTMEEERKLIGESTWAIQKYTEVKKISDYFKQKGIDLQAPENEGLKKLADILKGDVISGYDAAQRASENWMNGMKSGLATYLDQISNVAKTMEQTTTKVFKGMEDSLVSFIMTGKFDFRSFANLVIEELVRMMVQMMIMKPIVEMFKASMGGDGGGGGFWAMMFSAKGNTFDSGRRYSKGGTFSNQVVDSPTNFMMGQMGERGPEAVMPLTRDSQGRLGVRTEGGGGGVGNVSISVVVNNGQTESETTVGDNDGAVLGNRLKAVALQVIHEELRPGGSLSGRRG